MADAPDPVEPAEREHDDSFGVLVGWTHNQFNGRINLRLQTMHSWPRQAPREPDSHHVIMTKNQAAVLANYLFQISGQTPPRPRKRRLLSRILGR